DGRISTRRPAARRDRRAGQRSRGRPRIGRPAIRASRNIERGWPRPRPANLPVDRRIAWRAPLAPLPGGGRNRVPIFAAARSIASDVTMPGPTIFFINDQESVRPPPCEMLSVFGFTVETYDSADAFLQAIDRLPSGCVVADVRMPGTDGIELVRELGRRKVALPVVLISGHADVPMAVAGIKSGAEDFIE